jgi:hypothetical protein
VKAPKKHLDPIPNGDFLVLHCLCIGSSVSVSDRIKSESIWLKFSRCLTFNAYSRGVIYNRNIVIIQATDFFLDESNREALEYC